MKIGPNVQSIVLAGIAALLAAGCSQFSTPTAPAATIGGAASSGGTQVKGGGANGPQASVTLEMDLTVTVTGGNNDVASGTILVADNHLDDASKQIAFRVTALEVSVQKKTNGPWPGGVVVTCTTDPVLPTVNGLNFEIVYTCPGLNIEDSNATRVTANVTIEDVEGNIATFTARASAKSDAYVVP